MKHGKSTVLMGLLAALSFTGAVEAGEPFDYGKCQADAVALRDRTYIQCMEELGQPGLPLPWNRQPSTPESYRCAQQSADASNKAFDTCEVIRRDVEAAAKRGSAVQVLEPAD